MVKDEPTPGDMVSPACLARSSVGPPRCGQESVGGRTRAARHDTWGASPDSIRKRNGRSGRTNQGGSQAGLRVCGVRHGTRTSCGDRSIEQSLSHSRPFTGSPWGIGGSPSGRGFLTLNFGKRKSPRTFFESRPRSVLICLIPRSFKTSSGF
jgi:hypothetical protein